MQDRKFLLAIVWAIVISLTIPEIILRAFLQVDTSWMVPARIGLLVCGLVVSLAWSRLRPLWKFFLVMLMVYLVEGFFFLSYVPSSPAYINLVGDNSFLMFFGERLLRIFAVIVVGAVLFGIGYKAKDLFLRVGNLKAIAESSRYGLLRKPEPWTKFGRNYALISVVLLILFLIPAFSPAISNLSLSVVAFAAICALMNAFAEEFLYRAALIPQLEPLIGKANTLAIVPIWFGLAHYFGVPSGVTGVLLAAIGGWFFAKSMLETRGMGWPLFLHFLGDFTVYLILLLAGRI